MNESSLFSRRVLISLVAAMTMAFAASLLLTTGRDGGAEAGDSVGANSYSLSAIGHAGFFEVLRTVGRPVLRSQFEPLGKLGANGVLVLAEPISSLASDEGRNKLFTARRILLILPKWGAVPSLQKRTWIGDAAPLPISRVQSVLSVVDPNGIVVRVPGADRFDRNVLSANPALEVPVQLIGNSKMTALISSPDGILLGEIREGTRRIWVLADPDIIENHGIGAADNATLAVDIIDQLRGNDGPIVIDETIHGFRGSGTSPLALLTAFPFGLLGIHALAAVVLLLWATIGRFGAPARMKPVFTADKRALIANTAALIDHGGHHAAMLRRYGQVNVQEAARALRAPRGLSEVALIAWLDRAGKSRGLKTQIGDHVGDFLGAAVNSKPKDSPKNLPRAFARARAMYFWKKEIVDGFAGRKRNL